DGRCADGRCADGRCADGRLTIANKSTVRHSRPSAKRPSTVHHQVFLEIISFLKIFEADSTLLDSIYTIFNVYVSFQKM
ncbi:MAG: hypothetical protein ACPGXZ_14225, partial [Saprospiraceae bacterium]